MFKFRLILLVVIWTAFGCTREKSDLSTTAAILKTPSPKHEDFIVLVNELSEDLKEQLTTVIGTSAAADDIIHVLQAPVHRRLARLVIPSGDSRTRLRNGSIAAEIPHLARLAKGSPHDTVDQLDIPRLASTVNSLRETDAPVRIVLLGSLIYSDEQEEGWSMSEGRVPSDGALCSDRSECPLGPGNRTAFPSGTEVFWFANTPNWGVNERQRGAVVRCWQHFFETRGARLRQVSTDLRAVFQRAMNSGSTDRSGDLQSSTITAPPDAFVGMYDYSHKSVAIPMQASDSKVLVIPAPDGIQTTSVVMPHRIPAAIEQAIEQKTEHLQAGEFFVASIWTTTRNPEQCDIDIWCRLRPGHTEAIEMNFQHPETSLGRLFRDVRTAGEIQSNDEDFMAWEAMEIRREPHEVEIWLNAFHTNAPVTVRVIIARRAFDGTIKRQEKIEKFNIQAGDQANGSTNRHASSAWLKVDINN